MNIPFYSWGLLIMMLNMLKVSSFKFLYQDVSDGVKYMFVSNCCLTSKNYFVDEEVCFRSVPEPVGHVSLTSEG